MAEKIKAILFDMDGTVLDSEGIFSDAQIELLKEYNIKSNHSELEEFKGMSHYIFYPSFMKKFNIVEDIDIIRFKLRNHLHNIMETKLKYIKGFENFYISIIRGSNLKTGLVTNTTRTTFKKIQQFINIDYYFSFVITITEAIEPKPSPKPYLQAMNHFSIKPSETLIIEDSKTGLISAVDSGAQVIGLTTSLLPNQIKKISSKIVVVDSYSEIKKIVNFKH